MPVYENVHDTVQWHFNDITYRLVAKSGNPADRFHLGKIILQSLEDNGDQILQIDGYTGEDETNASVLKRTKQCAVAFKKLGVRQDDVIVLMAPNHLDLTIPLYAGLALGAPIAPVDRFSNVNELKDTFSILTPKIICCQNERVDDVKIALEITEVKSTIISFDGGNEALKFSDFIKNENVDDFAATTFDPSQTAILIQTSGTTGLPKYVEATHKNFVIMSPPIWSNSVKIPPFGSFFVVAPLQWVTAALMYLNAPILKMSRVQSSLNLTQEHAYDLINKYKPNFLILSPTMMTTLIKPGEREKCDFSCFDYMLLGGSAVHSDLIDEIKKIVPNTTVVINYGMSEVTGMAFESKYSTPSYSCGKPMRTLQYRLVDHESGKDVIDKPNVNGELWLKGPGIFKGYYKNPEATKETFSEDGWLKTGDMMYRDENWNFYFVERIKLLLKYRSHHMYPVEFESVIRQHPGVLDVAVTGIPHAEYGDLPVACVVTRSGYKVNAQEIKDLVKANLPDAKQLRGGVLFINELPMTASTKVHRRKLKELVLNTKLEYVLLSLLRSKRKIMPVYKNVHDTVQWHFNDITYRLVAKSGNPADRFHLGKIILQSLEDNGDQILQIDGYTGEEETNASVLQRTKQCAVAFKKLGVRQDDVIVLMAPNHLDLTIPLYAGLALGAPIAPVDRSLGVNELRDTFSILTPKIICCQNERVDDVKIALEKTGVKSTIIISFDGGNGALKFSDFIEKENVDDFAATTLDPSQTAILIPTSGTTGLPKYAEGTHKNFVIMNPPIWSKTVNIPPCGSFFVAAPIQWISVVSIYLNAPILKMSRVQSSLNLTQEHAYDLINKYKPNFLILSPTMMTTLIKPGEREKCDFSCFDCMMLGGSAVHSDLVAEIKKIVPNTTVVTCYGISEVTGLAFESKYSTPSYSFGKPMRTCQYRLVDHESGKDVIDKPNVNGELWLNGPGIFKGYYKNPEATKETFSEDGWFKTGDMMYRDENWNFYFVERIKLLLKYRNHQISPVELESVIRQHPGVLDVAVTGIPDAEYGDLPVACVVTRSGYKVTAQEIKDLVKANLTDTKQLRGGVLFLNELPMTTSTKVHRRKLKELVLNTTLE